MGYMSYAHKSTNKGLPPSANFNQPMQELPTHGEGQSYFNNGVAPLEIKTSNDGFHHVIKILQSSNKQVIGEYFIQSGRALKLEVPLGSYELRYASGKVWYGYQYLFGVETTYNKADQIFKFTNDGNQVNGYTIELIMQQNGNLETSGLTPAQW